MDKIQLTKNSIENAILTDGKLVGGYVDGDGYISAKGNGAVAMGYANGAIDASGSGAHAEGYNTKALADGAHAEGCYTTASGTASHAEGQTTAASGTASHAEGQKTYASGTASHAEGKGTITTLSSVSGVITPMTLILGTLSATISQQSYTLQVGDIVNYGSKYAKVTEIVNTNKTCTITTDISLGVSLNKDIKLVKGISYGENAHSEGQLTAATGNYSHAGGYQAIASGNGSFAHGYVDSNSNSYINAIGDGAVATGYVSQGGSIKAKGAGAHAEGCAYQGSMDASGYGAHAEGVKTKALAEGAHAEGYETIASGNYSHAEGYYTTASGKASHAGGYVSGGVIDASGIGSFAHGCARINSTISAKGDGAHAEGYAYYNSAISASGNGAVAMGYAYDGKSIKASGNGAHAEGYGTNALADGAHAEGYNTTATGSYSHAEGCFSKASGNYSHAGGFYTIANVQQVTAIGRYNQDCSDGDLFVIGNGTGANAKRKSVFVVSDSSGATNGGNDAKVTVIGQVNATGGFYDESDIRKKEVLSNISLEKSYKLLDKCQEIIYVLKDDPNKKEQVGMIAQEVEEFFPEIISTDNNGFKSLDYARLSVICLRLIKDIVEQIKEIKNEIKNLKN